MNEKQDTDQTADVTAEARGRIKQGGVHSFSGNDPINKIRKIRSSKFMLSFLVLLWIFWWLIPCIYQITTKVPEISKLNKTSGHLIVKEIPRKRPIIGINLADGHDEYFSCREPILGRSSCDYFGTFNKYVGNDATVYWYKRDIYPFISINYAVEIVVNNNTVLLSKKSTMNSIYLSKKYGVYASSFVLLAWIIFFIYNKYKSNK